MNILNKVTLQVLKRNKTRTVVTIIGVILATAMITAVATFISSLQNFLVTETVKTEGNWYVSAQGITSEQVYELKDKKEVEKAAEMQYIGYSYLEDSKNDYKPYIFIAGFNNDLFDMLPVNLKSGRLPQNSSEIVISEHTISNGGVNIKVGEKIELDVGIRESDGYQLWQENPFGENEGEEVESLNVKQTKTYTVVGICERPGFESYSAPGYTAITLSDNTIDNGYGLYIRTEKANGIYDFAKQSLKEMQCKYEYNDELLMFMGVSQNNSFKTVLYTFAAILIALIMFGSISLIYNAFSISVGERTKQFGLLSSVGATGKQLNRSVLFEALFVSLIGIPLGVLAGVGGIGATLYLTEDLFISLSPNVTEGIKLHVSVLPLIMAALLSLVTVLISAIIPARRASRQTVMSALRQSKDIKISAKKVKVSKLTYKLFGLEGTLARKNFKRQRRRYRSTVVSLFLSIVLFVTASAFEIYLTRGTSTVFKDSGYDLSYYGTPKDSDDIINLFPQLASADKVTMASYYRMCSGKLISSYTFTEDYSNIVKDYEDGPYISIILINDECFKAYAEGFEINSAEYFDAENPKLLLYAHMNYYDRTAEKYRDYDVFEKTPETLDFKVYDFDSDESERESTAKSFDIKIGNVVDKLPACAGGYEGNGIIALLPESLAKTIFADSNIFREVNIVFKTDDDTKSVEAINKILSENSLPTSRLFNHIEMLRNTRNFLLIIKIFSYGFITLISLISIANVFNTISTNIKLRRREFAMLKSVGMTKKGFFRMFNYECILYGIKSLIYGLPTALGLSYLIYKGVTEAVDMGFIVPYTSIAISVICVFIVVFATMIYSARKLQKENIIDALKDENI